jgi:ubiquinone/menaquinone biosynthesis C-methylase UbiE
MTHGSYIIRGGAQGRERLRILARVMRPSTLALLGRVGLCQGMRCLDVGCGGGDVTADLARLVGPEGCLIGVDFDEAKLELARSEAASAGLTNVTFEQRDILAGELPVTGFDLVYSRFLLTHLREPRRAVERMRDLLTPGGLLVVEDIDFSGHFIHPPSEAFAAYVDLYRRAARLRGADSDIGPRLPGMLQSAGMESVEMQVAQPAGLRGEVKLVAAITMEAIADAVMAGGLATRERIEATVAELYRLARDDVTVMSVVRVVQAWGRKTVDRQQPEP